MKLFQRKTRLESRITQLEGDVERLLDEREELQDKNFTLKSELRDVKHKKKIEEEEIRHLVKIREEKLEIQHERRCVEVEGEKAKAIEAVKDTYRDKIEKGLEQRSKEIRNMYTEILERLPNVNVMLGNEREATTGNGE